MNAGNSQFFNAAASGQTGHATSYYASLPRGFTRSYVNPFERQSSLCFDISNNYIQASLDVAGTLQAARAAQGATRCDDDTLRGVYVRKLLLSGGPWRFDLIDSAGSPLPVTGTRVDLLANLIPLATFEAGPLHCQVTAFAPDTADRTRCLPCVIYTLRIANPAPAPFNGQVVLPGDCDRWLNVALALNAAGQAGLHVLGPVSVSDGRVAVSLEPGAEMSLPVALSLADGADAHAALHAVLVSRSAEEWLAQTLSFHAGRLGQLQVEDNYYAEGLLRMEELCRAANLRAPDGACVGGTLGSNVNPGAEEWWNTNVWMKDNFYSALPMALFHPDLCEQAILFYMRWGVPLRAYGRGVGRYPDAVPLINSVSNSLSAIVLAGAYYRATGRSQFLLDHPEFLDWARKILARLLAARRYAGIMLFTSMYVSDGDARGDFHTGTNVVAWFAFSSMARLCREVYGLDAPAREYQSVADHMRADINRWCAGDGLLGRQYYEGADVDGAFIPGHDGEESDAGLMPFYGLCDSSDPALIRHSRLALTSYNPYYNRAVDGVVWFDGGDSTHTTFPCFTSALSGAQDEAELLQALERIRRLTDLDGSVWWWPQRVTGADPALVERYPQKCAWAAGAYVLKVVNDVLGIWLDYPARQVRLRPFSPWRAFAWDNCRIGDGLFDFGYHADAGKMAGRVVNRTAETFMASVELTLPAGAQPLAWHIDGEPWPKDALRVCLRYSRPCYIATRALKPGEALHFAIDTTE